MSKLIWDNPMHFKTEKLRQGGNKWLMHKKLMI